jgi:hypothetical protein
MNTAAVQKLNLWKAEFRDKKFRSSLIFSILALAVILFILTRFLNFVESRPGVTLNDPLLQSFSPVDLTWIIFGIIYLSLITALISLLPDPRALLFAIQLYTLMILVRIIAMYLLPLEPPDGMILLNDPFVEYFGTGETLTKDLFFSGHTASILVFFLTAHKKTLKIIFATLLLLIGVLVILQKVHYTIDVYAAVFFTLSCYYILKEVKQRFNI